MDEGATKDNYNLGEKSIWNAKFGWKGAVFLQSFEEIMKEIITKTFSKQNLILHCYFGGYFGKYLIYAKFIINQHDLN